MFAQSTEPSAAHQIPKQITECGCFGYLKKIKIKKHTYISIAQPVQQKPTSDSMRSTEVRAAPT